MKRGIVSTESKLVLRSTEIQPPLSGFVLGTQSFITNGHPREHQTLIFATKTHFEQLRLIHFLLLTMGLFPLRIPEI